MRKQVVNVVDLGADPSGRADSIEAFREALKDNEVSVLVPLGTYRIGGLIRGEVDEQATPAEPVISDEVRVEVRRPDEE